MARQLSNQILEKIRLIVQEFPRGTSIENIMIGLNSELSKRTLQRYLALLIDQNQITIAGKARATRYFTTEEVSPELEPTIPLFLAEEPASYYIPKASILLSQKSQAIQTQVRQPIQGRRPVGYNRNFLNRYHPNKTYYLSESTRKHLLEIGKAPGSERPAGTYARQILNRLLIDLSWNSSRLEGNTYSLLETERLLNLGEAPKGKDTSEAQMILNHKAAIEFLIESADQISFNRFTILNLHAILSDNLLHDQEACGNLRTSPVGICKSVYQPLGIPQLIDEYFQQVLDTASAIINPFEQSFFVMVHLPYLQPFLDVNKRTSRLAANISFIRENLCPLSFVDVPEQLYVSGLLGIYELNQVELLRDVFVWAYERSCSLYSVTRQEMGEPDPFRLHYRTHISTMVSEVIHSCMNKQEAVAAIKQRALEICPADERAKFIQVIETQLMGLHLGNIARYRIRPSEYALWLKTWQ